MIGNGVGVGGGGGVSDPATTNCTLPSQSVRATRVANKDVAGVIRAAKAEDNFFINAF
jgi:hypothetical protein